MSTQVQRPTAANRFGLNYAAEAARFRQLPYPIIDAHTHLSGRRAVEVYQTAARHYGIGLTYSMTGPAQVAAVRDVLGNSVRFIATHDFLNRNVGYAVTDGFLERIPQMRKMGARMTKFWAAPRGIDMAEKGGLADAMRIDSPHYRTAMRLTESLGMAAMVHVGDPDTWFATKYADANRYGTKAEQYERFESVLDEFSMPFIAAHCGGWPEDLSFLNGLLRRHANLYLDTSATKWMVRELSRHASEDLHEFLQCWQGRILFGSDIVVSESHLSSAGSSDEMSSKSRGKDEAFDLYASRYWALRTLFETDYNGESPIADPDLAMVQPDIYSKHDAPPLVGKQLPPHLLQSLFHDAAHDLLESIYQA